MPVVIYELSSGERREVTAHDGDSVMRTALNNLVPGIVGECGGQMSCATCHVYVDPQWAGRLPAPAADELDMLEATAAEPTEYSRLSCQLKCTDATSGLVVRVPDEQ